MPPTSVAGYVVDTGFELGQLGAQLTWLPMQLRFRLLCAGALACLGLGPSMVDAWIRLAVLSDGQLVPGPAADGGAVRRRAATWAVTALEHAVVMLGHLAQQARRQQGLWHTWQVAGARCMAAVP